MADLRGRVTFAQKECLCHLHSPCMVSWSLAECCYLNIYESPFYFLFTANYLLKWYRPELIKMVPLKLFWSWHRCRWDRARGIEIGNKDVELEYLEEAFTTSNWIVRIYKVKPSANRR